MNYYNPYFSTIPYSYTPTVTASKGLLSSLFGGGKLSSILNGTGKALNVVNQTIPLVKQMSPIMKNAKTMFKVMNEFKRVDTPNNSKNNSVTTKTSIDNTNNVDNDTLFDTNNNISKDGPTFFM